MTAEIIIEHAYPKSWTFFREQGPDAVAVLHDLLVQAEHLDGRLVVRSSTRRVAQRLGFLSKDSAHRRIRQLCAAGVLQALPRPAGDRFAKPAYAIDLTDTGITVTTNTMQPTASKGESHDSTDQDRPPVSTTDRRVHASVRDTPMTVRVTTLRGDEAGAYYLDQPGLYYLDGDEPDGVWRGGGATTLGLHGAVEPEAFLALMAGQDPNTGRLLGTKHTERTVRGFDITFSAPKWDCRVIR